MFTNMTIGKKLFLSIGAALTAALVMGVLMFVSLSRVGAGMDRVVNENAKGKSLANEIDNNLTELISLERGMVLKSIIKDQASIDKYHEDYRTELTKLNANVAQFAPLVKTPEGQAFVAVPHLQLQPPQRLQRPDLPEDQQPRHRRDPRASGWPVRPLRQPAPGAVPSRSPTARTS